jgi:competence protein ComEA
VRLFAIVGVLLVAAVLVLFRPAVRAPAQAGFVVASPFAKARPARRFARITRDAPASALAYVAGSVQRPGVYPVPAGARVRDLLAAAGGTRGDADLVAVNLAAHVEDGDEVVVPARGELAPRHRTRRVDGPRRRRHARGRGGRRARAAPPDAPLDLNAADATQLAQIPGIGPTLADRIVAFRTANGPFASTDELLDVEGFTDKRLDAVTPYLLVR